MSSSVVEFHGAISLRYLMVKHRAEIAILKRGSVSDKGRTPITIAKCATVHRNNYRYFNQIPLLY